MIADRLRQLAETRAADPAADHAAEAIVIYDLQRSEAFELDGGDRRAARYELTPPISRAALDTTTGRADE